MTFNKVTKLLYIWYELFWIHVHTSVWQQAIISKQQIRSKIIICFKNYAAMIPQLPQACNFNSVRNKLLNKFKLLAR